MARLGEPKQAPGERRQIVRGVHGFVAIENILDKEYDTARTPIRSIGWPRTVRAGARITWQ